MKHALPLLALLALVLPAQVQARPVAATLSPSGAMVTEEETSRLLRGRAKLFRGHGRILSEFLRAALLYYNHRL